MITVQQRQTLIISLLVVFLISIGAIVVYFYTLCSLNILTNSPNNTIIVEEVLPNGARKLIETDDNKAAIDLRVSAGTYIVTAKYASIVKSQTVTVSRGENKKIILNISSSQRTLYTASEPVTSLTTFSLTASQQTMRFFDPLASAGALYTFDKSGDGAVLAKNISFSNIRWASPEFGIGMGTDKNTNSIVICIIEGDSVKIIKPPFKPTKSSSVAVSPNKTWYVSDGKNIYIGYADGSFKKIFATDKPVSLYSASDDAVFAIQNVSPQQREGAMMVIHNDGKRYQLPGSAYGGAWSPSGKLLVTTGDVTRIFDDRLNPVSSTPNTNFTGYTWLDEDTILYTEGHTINRYKISTGESVPFIDYSKTTNGKPSGLTLSVEKDYLYVTIQNGGPSSQLAYKLTRIALNNQPTSDVKSTAMDIIIPNTIKGCDLQYVNLGQFTILTTNKTTNSNCTPVITDYLASYNIPMSNIYIKPLH